MLASLGPIYQVSLKSANDPIIAVEDLRLEAFSMYSTAYFLSNYSDGSTQPLILCDYKNGLYLGPMLEDKYDVTSFYGSGSKFTPGVIPNFLLFDNNGLQYGSIYVSPELYQHASSLIENQSIIYSSGNETILYISGQFG
jgi:hypothetical protein